MNSQNKRTLSESTRRELYNSYTQMCELYNQVRETLRIDKDNLVEVEQAKAYWLGFLDLGLNSENYVGGTQTFRDFLQINNIMDDDEEFIEQESEEYDEE